MIAARQREREFFSTNRDYAHLSSKMGSEYLARLLSKVSMYPCIVSDSCWRDMLFWLFFSSNFPYLPG